MTAKFLLPSRKTTSVVVSLVAASLATLQARAEEPMYKNRFGLSYRIGLNVRGSFRNLGSLGPASNPGMTGSQQNHTYDDGYVLNDSGGNVDTWNWGYQNSSQWSVNNDTLQFNSSLSQGDGRLSGLRGDPQHGMEFSYERWLGPMGRTGNWGLRHTFNYANITIKTSRSTTATAVRTTDTYALMGVVPPEAPYSGSFDGPGPLIPNDLPPAARTIATIVGGATVSGHHEIDANLYGWQLGPYFEFPLSPRWNMSFGGGLALAIINSDFRFSESATVSGAMPGDPSVTVGSAQGSDNQAEFLCGGYAGMSFSYYLDPQWSLVAGAEYQFLTKFKQEANGREARLEFPGAVFVRVGLNFSF